VAVANEALRTQAIERVAQAIVDLVDSETETLADDLWRACAEAGSRLRRRAPRAVPVVRTDANLEALGHRDQASRRFDAFAYFLLSPVPDQASADDKS
jgi:hypothetical protein